MGIRIVVNFYFRNNNKFNFVSYFLKNCECLFLGIEIPAHTRASLAVIWNYVKLNNGNQKNMNPVYDYLPIFFKTKCLFK